MRIIMVLGRICLVLLLPLAALMLLPGCSKEISGEVFIVTKGRENVRLALTEIQAFSEKDILDHFAKKKLEREANRPILEDQITSLGRELDRAEVERQAKSTALSVAAQELLIKLNNASGLERAYENGRRDDVRPLPNRQLGNIDLSRRSTNFLSPRSASSESRDIYHCKEPNGKTIYQQTPCATPEPKEVPVVKDDVTRYGVEIEVAKREEALATNKMGAAMRESSVASNEVELKNTEILLAKTKLELLSSDLYFLEGLPAPKTSTKTNANGEFKLSLPRFSGKFALFATTKRRVFEKDENYIWFVWVDDTSSPVLLSVDNLMETKCASCVKF